MRELDEGGVRMTREEYRQLSDLHVQHGKALLDAGLYAGAWYISGYAVECGLKACIAKLFRVTADDEFPEPVSGNPGGGTINLRSHNFKFLVLAAGLKLAWDGELNSRKPFRDNWKIVNEWSPEARYDIDRLPFETNEFYSAIVDPNHGVMECIGRHW